MKVLLTGASGLIGSEVGKRLHARGDLVVVLARNPDVFRQSFSFSSNVISWRHTDEVPAAALDGVEAVIHLAGEPIAGGGMFSRWTEEKKRLISETRVLGTKHLVEAIHNHGKDIRVFVHGSAGGYVGDRGDELLDATSAKGTGFLADVVEQWENETLALPKAIRRTIIRTGVVLARQGGALPLMLPLFKLHAGGRLGHGKQWMSWIHLDDMADLILHALDSSAVSGVLEGCAPNPVTNAEFTQTLCRELGVFQNLPVPALALKLLLGEKASVVLEGYRMNPTRTLASGYDFKYKTLQAALRAALTEIYDGR